MCQQSSFLRYRQDHALKTRSFSKALSNPWICIYGLRKAFECLLSWLDLNCKWFDALTIRFKNKKLDNLNTSRILYAVTYTFFVYLFKTEVIYETTFFCKKDCISVLKSQLILCAQNTKCFTQRLHPIGGAQGTSDYIRMHFTTWGKISCSLLVGIWFQQVTPQKPFRMICEPFGTKNFKVSSPSKCTAAEISARIWRLRVSPTAGSAGKGVFLRHTDERNAFWLKCESQHAMCEKTRRNSPRVCGWADFIVHLSCAPWVIFNSLEPFPHQRTTKKVSSPHVKCNFFCSKPLKKVVSYLTSVLRWRLFEVKLKRS